MLYIKENYERFYGEKPEASSYGNPIDIVRKIKNVLPNGTVLDVGAGDGRHALYLASEGFTVTAVDLSQAGLEKLQRRAASQHLQISVEMADLNTWSIHDTYNAIITTATLQHLKHDAAIRILGQIKSHTRPGGINIVAALTKSGDRYLLDREEDPEAFYPTDNWLRDFYAGWEIIEHSFIQGALIGKFRPDGTPMQNTTERVLARKPQSS
ncbi:MAG: methyltransferase domain-containing protein [Candidatus Doudnabacteria bacterium]|nr:methyltransferase domain-containing protein [Candidatus Doudnabacteria bacterium]